MKRRRIWLRGAAALAAVWVIATAGVWIARSQKMTAEKTLAYMNAHRLAGLSAAERRKIIEELASRVNRLSFDERQKFRFEKGIRQAFEEMTDEERASYLDRTLPKGMQQMMEAFNQMTPVRRKQIVNRALNDMNRMRDEMGQQELTKSLTDQNVQRIIDEGMKNYISGANAETKLDLQPLIEQMQSIMQMAR
jgi:hypothetical protein